MVKRIDMSIQVIDRHDSCAFYTEYDSINDVPLEHWQVERLREMIGLDSPSRFLGKVNSRWDGQRERPMELPF